MPTTAPSFTDNVTIVASATLARNATTRGTIDLRSKYGMYLFARIGRQGTTALTNGVDLVVRRTLNNDGIAHPEAPIIRGQSAAAQSTTVNADSNSGQAILNVASTTSWTAGDIALLGGGTAREEWVRVARVTDATHLLLDRNLQFTHTAGQADTIRNKADVFPAMWFPGGALYEVIFDYGDDAAGESVTVEAKAQTYDVQTQS
jgi:hypothetical protein